MTNSLLEFVTYLYNIGCLQLGCLLCSNGLSVKLALYEHGGVGDYAFLTANKAYFF